jgi:hypothetical protein
LEFFCFALYKAMEDKQGSPVPAERRLMSPKFSYLFVLMAVTTLIILAMDCSIAYGMG